MLKYWQLSILGKLLGMQLKLEEMEEKENRIKKNNKNK